MKRIFKIFVIALCIFTLMSLTFAFVGKKEDASVSGASSSQQKVDFSKLSYVAFGDSITYGADYSKNYSQMDNPYPELVADYLGFRSVKNEGVSGATFCKNNLGRLCMTDVILNYTGDADIISVMLGVNDYYSNLPLGDINDKSTDTVYGSLNLIGEYLTSKYKDSFVFFMTPYQTAGKSDSDYSLAEVSKAIKKVAAKYGIPVLDMFSLGKFELEMYQSYSDGVHPTQEFFETYTKPQIVDFIKSKMK